MTVFRYRASHMEMTMRTSIKSATVGFAVGLALAAATAQAAQHEQHAQPPASSAQAVPTAPAKPMHMMMGDPAKHQQMMEQMGQCRDMMSKMMENMKHGGQMPMQPPVPPKQ